MSRNFLIVSVVVVAVVAFAIMRGGPGTDIHLEAMPSDKCALQDHCHEPYFFDGELLALATESTGGGPQAVDMTIKWNC